MISACAFDSNYSVRGNKETNDGYNNATRPDASGVQLKKNSLTWFLHAQHEQRPASPL